MSPTTKREPTQATGVGYGSGQESAYGMAKSDLDTKIYGRFSRPGTNHRITQVLYLEDRKAPEERRWEVLIIADCYLPSDNTSAHVLVNKGRPPGKR